MLDKHKFKYQAILHVLGYNSDGLRWSLIQINVNILTGCGQITKQQDHNLWGTEIAMILPNGVLPRADYQNPMLKSSINSIVL